MEAITVEPTDFTVVVQNGDTKKLKAQRFFENIKVLPNFDSEETLVSSSQISNSTMFSILEPANSSQTFTLVSPTIKSTIKYIINNSAFQTTIINGAENIVIQSNEVVLFTFLKSKWWKLNG